MKRIFALFLVNLLSMTALASNQDLFDIIDLADQIKLAARTTTATDADLQDVKLKLKEVLAILNNTNPNQNPNQDCINFAYSKYYVNYDSQTATHKSIEACKKIVDLNTAKYLFDKYYITLTAALAMDEAANRSGPSKVGKEDMLSFAFDKYYITLTAQESANRASSVIDLLPRGRLSCLQNLYSKYYQTLTSVMAMDQAASDCR